MDWYTHKDRLRTKVVKQFRTSARRYRGQNARDLFYPSFSQTVLSGGFFLPRRIKPANAKPSLMRARDMLSEKKQGSDETLKKRVEDALVRVEKALLEPRASNP